MVKTCQNNVQTFTCRVPETNPIIHAIRKPTDLPAGSRALGPRFLDLPPAHPNRIPSPLGCLWGYWCYTWPALVRHDQTLDLFASPGWDYPWHPLAEQPGGQGAMEVDALIQKKLACTGGGPALLFHHVSVYI